MKTVKKPPVTDPALLNVSIPRAVLNDTGDFLSALIVGLIDYRFCKNDKKPVYLKINWIHEKLPYISRAGLAKKIAKLVKDGHIIMEKGKGRHYHKCYYSPSTKRREACAGKVMMDPAKVYFNLEMAKENLEASVVYAAIANLLRQGDKLVIDTQKLSEGSGLSIGKVRQAIAWLITKKKIQAKEVFGNKKQAWLPIDNRTHPVNSNGDLTEQLPTESYPHFDPPEDEPTEIYPHVE
jgi:ribosomal protein L19E